MTNYPSSWKKKIWMKQHSLQTLIETFHSNSSYSTKSIYVCISFSQAAPMSQTWKMSIFIGLISLPYTPVSRDKNICTLPISTSVNKKLNDHSQHVPNTKSKEGDHRVIKNDSPKLLGNWKITRPTRKSSQRVLWNTAKCSTISDIYAEDMHQKDTASKTARTELFIAIVWTK